MRVEIASGSIEFSFRRDALQVDDLELESVGKVSELLTHG